MAPRGPLESVCGDVSCSSSNVIILLYVTFDVFFPGFSSNRLQNQRFINVNVEKYLLYQMAITTKKFDYILNNFIY